MLDILQNAKVQNKMRILKNRAQFLRVAKGRRIANKSFSLQMIKLLSETSQMQAGIGYTITKKIGNSPERNRIKRRFRAAVEKCADYFHSKHDYVLIGRRKALSQPFNELVNDLKKSIYNIHQADNNSTKPNKTK